MDTIQEPAKESNLHPDTRRLQIQYAMSKLCMCRVDGWNKTDKERKEIRGIIRSFPDEKQLIQEYGAFCLSQYAMKICEPEHSRAEKSVLQSILHESARLVRISKGCEDSLVIFSEILAVQMKSYDRRKLDLLSNDCRYLNDFFENNSLIDHIVMKNTLLQNSKQGEKMTSEIQALKNSADIRMISIAVDLLTNIYLTEEIAELRFIQKYVLSYMTKIPQSEILIGEYAEMLSFMSINNVPDDVAWMISLGRELLGLFPALESVQTGYAGILYSGIQFQEVKQSMKCRRELVQLIYRYPKNKELLTYYKAGMFSIDWL